MPAPAPRTRDSHFARSGRAQVRHVMTRDVAIIAPDTSLREAARRMDDLNVGALPVADRGHLVGIITDRDITVRATAAGQPPDTTRVDGTMTTDVTTCHPDDDLVDVADAMSRLQVRRLPVIDDEGTIVGILTLGDLAAAGSDVASDILRRVSEPARPDRSGSGRVTMPASHRDDVERSDDVISQDVASRLLKLDDVNSGEIEIEVESGYLTVSGTVDNYALKQAVERELRAIEAVKDIDNNLRIRKDAPKSKH